MELVQAVQAGAVNSMDGRGLAVRPKGHVTSHFASFDLDWTPEAYLAEYYTEVQQDEQVTLRFLAEAAVLVGEVRVLLEFGCGPTVHHLLPFANVARTIHVADYLRANLVAVRRWVDEDDEAWDWSAFAEAALSNELGRPPDRWEVADRLAKLRRQITEFHDCDARRQPPMISGSRQYPAVLCCFCPDSITDDLDEWRRCTANIASLVAPGGWLVLTALGRAASYRVGAMQFPSARVTGDDIAELLGSIGFSRRETTIVTLDAADAGVHGFDSVLAAVSRRL